MVYIIMGISGCGKMTIGRILAKKLSIIFYNADDYYSYNNINKMENFIPLDDKERIPWLLDLTMHIAQWNRYEETVD